MLSWRRGPRAISQSLVLNLPTVLTVLGIWFLRWQIRNSILQGGRLLLAGTPDNSSNSWWEGRRGEPVNHCFRQSFQAHGKTVTPRDAEMVSPIQEALRCACTGYVPASPFPTPPTWEWGTPCFRKTIERYYIYDGVAVLKKSKKRLTAWSLRGTKGFGQ